MTEDSGPSQPARSTSTPADGSTNASGPVDDDTADTTTNNRRAVLASLALILAVGGVGILVPLGVPALSSVLVALTLGLLIANLAGHRVVVDPTVSGFVVKRVLRFAVILLGAGINVSLIADVSGKALLVIVACVVFGILLGLLVGRWRGLATRPALLIGVGTAICGASAIAAVASVVKAKKDEIGVALGTILCFNAVALIVYPAIGHAANFTSVGFGTWAGVGVHDAASAVAVGFALDAEAGEIATVVKLARTLLLVPLVIAIAVWVSVSERRHHAAQRTRTGRTVMSSIPWFVFGFAALATLNALGWLGGDGGVGDILNSIGRYLLVFVVATIGLTLRFSQVARIGGAMFTTGLIASIGVAGLGLLMIATLGIGITN